MIINNELETKLIQLMEQYPVAVLKSWALTWSMHIEETFQNAGYGTWESKFIDDGRSLLTGKTGLLKSSTSVEADLDNLQVVAGNTVPYGEIHQKGGLIPITKKMKKFFWAKMYENGQTYTDHNGKKVFEPDENGKKWMQLALMQKKYITIPARNYITIPDGLVVKLQKAAEEILKFHANKLKL